MQSSRGLSNDERQRIQDDVHHACPPSHPSPNTLVIITQNVWFGELCQEERFTALFATIEVLSPHIVCLQEVTPHFLRWIMSTGWVDQRYHLSDTTGASIGRYGVLMLVSKQAVEQRPPFKFHQLPTHLGRSLLTVDLLLSDSKCRIGTVHLESLKPNALKRAEQLQRIVPILSRWGDEDEQSDMSFLCGDFNFCSTWLEENANIPPDYIDMWPHLHPDLPGWSEDTEINRMLFEKEYRKMKQVRYDRCILRSPDQSWLGQSISLLGTTPIPNLRSPLNGEGVWISDHFGLHCTLKFRGAAAH